MSVISKHREVLRKRHKTVIIITHQARGVTVTADVQHRRLAF
jgi:hypothetical protein